MKRVYSGVVAAALCLSMMGSFTGCGEVKSYKTEHEFSDLNISSSAIKKLFFEDKCSPEKISRKIPDFCIYDDGYGDYEATGNVHITANNEYIANFKMTIHFNADKEFQYWLLDGLSFDEIEEPDKRVFRSPYYLLKDEFGEPEDGGAFSGTWEIDGYVLSSLGGDITYQKSYEDEDD